MNPAPDSPDADPGHSTDVNVKNDIPSNPEGPTDSHVLSQVEQDEKGLSQQAGDTAEITDLGWTDPSKHSEERLIAGLSNDDLWMLIRRFDKVCTRHSSIKA